MFNCLLTKPGRPTSGQQAGATEGARIQPVLVHVLPPSPLASS